MGDNITSIQPEDNNVTRAAKEYIEEGWYIVPLKDGDKMPVHNDWTDLTKCLSKYSDKIPPNLHGIGLALGHSRLCTVDLDALAKAKEYFTNAGVDIVKHLTAPNAVKIVSGRENRAKLLYRLPSNIESLRSVKKDAEGFELRCMTSKGTTLQDVLPPSIHPKTKRAYSWEGDWRKVPLLPDEILQVWSKILDSRKERTWSVDDLDIVEAFVDSALAVMSPDREYNEWLAIGMALDSVGMGDKWDDWSQSGSTYKPGDCDGRLEGFTSEGGVSIGSLWHYAHKEGWKTADAWDSSLDAIETSTSRVEDAARKLALVNRICKRGPAALEIAQKRFSRLFGVSLATLRADMKAHDQRSATPNDLTHEEIAEHYYRHVAGDAVATEGGLWIYTDGRWRLKRADDVVHEIGAQYREQKMCKVYGQYKGITNLVITRHVDESWFADAPKGIACADGFYQLGSDGAVTKHPHLPEQRQRWGYAAAPVPGDMPLLMQLFECLTEADVLLLQEFVGATLFQLGTTYQKALLLYGDTATGKSAFIKLMQKLCENTSVVAPGRFGEDYHRAGLAGSLFNSHTELPPMEAVDSSEFKAILAGDLIEARVVHQPVFKFMPMAAHCFSANTLPTVKTPEEAFWRRWIITHWRGAPSKVIREIEKDIYEQELPQILNWAIEGASRLVANDQFTLGKPHEAVVAIWKGEHNLIQQFLHADDSPIIFKEGMRTGKVQFSTALREWAFENGIKAPSRNAIIRMAKCETHLNTRWLDGSEIFDGIGIAKDL